MFLPDPRRRYGDQWLCLRMCVGVSALWKKNGLRYQHLTWRDLRVELDCRFWTISISGLSYACIDLRSKGQRSIHAVITALPAWVCRSIGLLRFPVHSCFSSRVARRSSVGSANHPSQYTELVKKTYTTNNKSLNKNWILNTIIININSKSHKWRCHIRMQWMYFMGISNCWTWQGTIMDYNALNWLPWKTKK